MNILIVDDETHAREAVKLLVEWKELGVDLILEADNGEAAKLLVAEHLPALVLTDVHMPITNGLRFMEWLSDHYPQTKIIAISGYNDFDYVRKTMKYGGIDYILKPIDPDQLMEASKRAIGSWCQETKERQRQVESGIAMNQYKPVYWSHLFGKLASVSNESEPAAAQLHSEFQGFPQQGAFQTAVFSLFPVQEKLLKRFRGDKELLEYAIINVFNDLMRSEWQCGYAFRSPNAADEVIALFWEGHDFIAERTARLLEAVRMTLRADLYAGIGRLVPEAEQTGLSVQSARQTLQRRNLLADGVRISHAGTVQPSAAPHLTDLEEPLRLALQIRNPAEATAALRDWFGKVRRSGIVTPGDLALWERQSEMMFTRLHKEFLPEDAEDEQAKSRTAPLPVRFDEDGRLLLDETEKEFRLLLLDWMESLLKRVRQDRSIIAEMISYIDGHLEEDLSLQTLASRFFLSREHVSRRFRQETGNTLSDYVEKLRMDKASRLLLGSSLKIAEISSQVGYSDEKYFSKVFKKHSGCSPGQYRKED
ncbi:helix-turn-helix domain-containing protein [Paenibacillus sp. D51F]